jgi:hypothetical protein
MQRLLRELGEAGVTEASLESRTSSLNKRDTVMVNALRTRGEIPTQRQTVRRDAEAAAYRAADRSALKPYTLAG